VATTFKLHEQLQQYNATPIYYKGMQWFAEFRNFFTDYEQKVTAIPIIIQPFTITSKYWQNVNTGPNKILVIADAELTNEIQNNLKQRFISQLNIYTSNPAYLELMNIEASKMNAVKFLIKRYG